MGYNKKSINMDSTAGSNAGPGAEKKKSASIQRMGSSHGGVDETSISRIYMLRSWMYVQLSPLLQVPF
jgi:hypothetical protein